MLEGDLGAGGREAGVFVSLLLIKEYIYTQTHVCIHKQTQEREREMISQMRTLSEQFKAAIFSEILGKYAKVTHTYYHSVI